MRSGATESILRDVESEPNATVGGEGTLTLGEQVVVSLLLGEDGVFSAGLSIVVECPEVPPDVGGAIVVTVEADCEVVDGEPAGEINVSVPVAGGAEIVITDSDGGVVGTFTEDGSVTVAEGQYTWEATPADGFEFPAGFEDSGTVTVACDRVLASIVVTVDAECEVVDDQGVGRITVVMSVAGGADVVIRDSSGDTVSQVSADGDVTVPEGASYTWQINPREGFELAPGAPDSGTLMIAECSPPVVDDEVSAVEVLPFTGSDPDWLVPVGIALLIMGGAVVVAARRVRV